jgi:hypothetical protein
MKKKAEELNYQVFKNLIKEKKEQEAIDYLNCFDETFDVSKFQWFIISGHLTNLFKKIVSYPTFDPQVEDSFGESMLISMIYLYGTDSISSEERQLLKTFINIILSCETYHFNHADLGNDTALSVSCEHLKLLWVTEKLLSIPSVNINTVNDFGYSPLTNCIVTNNIEALRLLARRTDLVVRDIDIQKANEKGISLKKYGIN